MKTKIAILGSTGSIGKSLIDILKRDKKKFEITLLTANKNYKDLIKQTNYFNVKNVIIINKNSYNKFKKLNKNSNIKIYNNFDNLNLIFKKKIDYVMSSIVGLDGLHPTLEIIKHTKKIAIANKESIVCGWNLIKRELNKYTTKFVPVDSEHFSIWYGLKNIKISKINKIYLTASGGPLLKIPHHEFNKIKIKDVLRHPNWKMGHKITVDSATMMNKVFEVIEAKNIFDIDLNNLDIVVHPQSYIHAIIHLNDGMIKLIAHETTMEIPIFNSLYDTKKYKFNQINLNLKKINNLNFQKINKSKFPLIEILNLIPNKISLFETVLISANDELVKMYLEKKIKYKSISKNLKKFLIQNEFLNLRKKSPKSLLEILNLDKYVRLKINSKSV